MVDGVQSDCHWFGECRRFHGEFVWDGEGQRLFDQYVFGVGVGCRCGQVGGVDVCVVLEQWECHYLRFGFQGFVRLGIVIDDFVAELVFEDDFVVGMEDAVVVDLVCDVGQLVAVVLGVQVRFADVAL